MFILNKVVLGWAKWHEVAEVGQQYGNIQARVIAGGQVAAHLRHRPSWRHYSPSYPNPATPAVLCTLGIVVDWP